MPTSNNLLYTELMKINVLNKRQGSLGPVGRWWAATPGWGWGTAAPFWSVGWVAGSCREWSSAAWGNLMSTWRLCDCLLVWTRRGDLPMGEVICGHTFCRDSILSL